MQVDLGEQTDVTGMAGHPDFGALQHLLWEAIRGAATGS
jgi:hypothetical protein